MVTIGGHLENELENLKEIRELLVVSFKNDLFRSTLRITVNEVSILSFKLKHLVLFHKR